jgi:phytoene desaturase
MGVSPFNAPAFYSVISYTDHVQKIRHSMGGMYEIPKALEKMAKKFGVKFHYNAEVKSITAENGGVIVSTDREKVRADKVVINADYAHAQRGLLKRRLPDYKYSCSVYLIYLGMKKKINGLEHHNLFFANDLNKNLKEIFNDKVISRDPSFYIHVPTVTDPALAPQGKDILYILVPVPNLQNCKEDFQDKEKELRRVVFGKINKQFGVDTEDLVEVEHRFYPQDFISRYNIKYGATFGLSHNLMQSAFFRPANIDSRNKNIYFVGASTQPGGGLPPVLASARIVADLITKDKK